MAEIDTDIEVWFTVPEQFITSDPEIKIGIAAHGGGTVGKSYAHNGWDYVVMVDGQVMIEGDDLRSGAPATHQDMAKTLCVFLSAAGESLQYSGADSEYADEYTEDVQQFLIDTEERFSLFGMEDDNAE